MTALTTLVHKTIVLGKSPDFITDCLLQLGTYCEFDEANNPSARTRGAISLNPTGNVQGSYGFMTLNTGQVVSRHQWTPLPQQKTWIPLLSQNEYVPKYHTCLPPCEYTAT